MIDSTSEHGQRSRSISIVVEKSRRDSVDPGREKNHHHALTELGAIGGIILLTGDRAFSSMTERGLSTPAFT
jgi:hypothetical protein